MQRYGYDGWTGLIYPAPDGEYVLHSEAQAEIERLRKEVDRLSEQNRALLDDQIPCACGYDDPDEVCVKHYPSIYRRIEAAHNAAIDAVIARLKGCGYVDGDAEMIDIRALKK